MTPNHGNNKIETGGSANKMNDTLGGTIQKIQPYENKDAAVPKFE